MKNYEVQVKCWVNGSGWSYNTTIDNVNEISQEICNEYAKDYFTEMEIEEEKDYKIVFIDENDEEIFESDWASDIKNN